MPTQDAAKPIIEATHQLSRALLMERSDDGWWVGELSTSALSTATACMALHLAAEHPACDQNTATRYRTLTRRGCRWLIDHQNSDGGWGDTVLSVSNISTTMLAHATLTATSTTSDEHADAAADPSSDDCSAALLSAQQYIDRAGGVDAVIRRYGKDRTFSVPILTHCALAGTVSWKRVIALPFELSCIPAKFYAAVRLPVVSYALPALIAIGQVIFHRKGHWNPLVRLLRQTSIGRSLRVLESIQPENGGFLEATPLTSFVCMSLLGCGRYDHRVTSRGLNFIEASVRDDGSWPIDTNLTTWVTTLSINALAGDPHRSADLSLLPQLNADERGSIRTWLLRQQYRSVHPYTNSPPGGWSWTDLPGGVPDADDTPGAMLAVLNLRRPEEEYSAAEAEALEQAALWLLGLQNRDGGWPTFCRGWGTLPFDRSSNDLTAHVLRALALWQSRISGRHDIADQVSARTEVAIRRGLEFLRRQQASDGSWLPLWFGHQHHETEDNPLYGTAKVVVALRELGLESEEFFRKALNWLLQNQNDDGSWSAVRGLSGSVEETGLALEAVAGLPSAAEASERAAVWLTEKVQDGTVRDPTPIGFYFAKLWYFERLYPLIFAAAGLRRYCQSEPVNA